jgi:membrane associated rhomboid family serine protease
LPRYPIAGGISLLAIFVTGAWWAKMDVSPLLETAMIRRGELWRLVTSILPHGGALHLIFNVYWLWVFGTLVEQVLGPIKTAGLILLFAVASNALEFAFLTGGIGLSGVGYGLFGLLWVLSSRDERFRDAVDRGTIQVFVVWFFVCIVLTLTKVMLIANLAHAGGAVLGILAGFAIARPDRRIPIAAGIGAFVLLSLGAATLWRPVLNLSGHAGYEEARWGYDALVANRNQEAARWFRDAVAYQPAMSEFWYDLGVACERVHDAPKAVRAYRKAAGLGSAEGQVRLGELYTFGSAGLPKDDIQALFWFRKAAAQNDPGALNSVAWAYATSTSPAIRNPAAALEFARKAVHLSKDHPVPAFLDTLAEAYYVNAQYEEAVKTEQQALALASPGDQDDYRMRLEKYQGALKSQGTPDGF